jgi:hypothetical protein
MAALSFEPRNFLKGYGCHVTQTSHSNSEPRWSTIISLSSRHFAQVHSLSSGTTLFKMLPFSTGPYGVSHFDTDYQYSDESNQDNPSKISFRVYFPSCLNQKNWLDKATKFAHILGDWIPDPIYYQGKLLYTMQYFS